MIVNQIWNPSLHRELVREDLHFLKLAFGPVFPRDEILNALPSSLAKQKIRSYAIYETTGVWDFFVRAWIPHDILVEQVIKEISATLPGAVTVTDWQSGTVTDILKHWVWEQDGHRWCYHSDEFNKNDAVLRSRLDAESISKTNHKNLSDDSYQELRRLGLVSRMSPTSGIKFIIEIPTVGTLESAQGFAKTVLDIVNGANEIKEKSCYALNGFAAFLIIGRVSERKFQRVHDQLLNAINRAGLSNLLRARTRTHIVIHSPSEPGYYQDHLPVELLSLQEPEPSLGELLQKGEGQGIEIKSTFSVNLRTTLTKQRNEADGFDARKEICLAVISMLNSDGGHVLIGGVEPDREPTLKEQLVSYPDLYGFRLIGIDLEPDAQDTDKLVLKIKQYLNSNIAPPPVRLVDIRLEQLEGKTLVVLKIARQRTELFFPKGVNDLVIRDGNGKKRLSQTDMVRYIREWFKN